MKKTLISLLALAVFNFSYGEEVYTVVRTVTPYMTEEQQEMSQRWERIKKMDAQITYQPDKEVLRQIHDDYDNEFKIYMEYLKENPSELFRVGDYYFRSGRYEKAYEVFSQNTGDVKSMFGAATAARFLADNVNALKFYNEIIEKNPKFYEAYLGRGIINRNMGNYEGAISDFKKYMEFVQDESVYLGLGDSYLASGKYAEAKNILEIGRSKFPQSSLIKEMLMKAYSNLK